MKWDSLEIWKNKEAFTDLDEALLKVLNGLAEHQKKRFEIVETKGNEAVIKCENWNSIFLLAFISLLHENNLMMFIYGTRNGEALIYHKPTNEQITLTEQLYAPKKYDPND